MRILIFPCVVALLCSALFYFWGGWSALALLLLLAVLETTLSFDNAVVNAKVLTRMNQVWQKRFLTWGIPVAVFGTRFILPLLIVSVAVGLSPVLVAQLAFFDPIAYGKEVIRAHTAIASFGSAFLLLVSLKYFFNDRKTVHWIGIIERTLSRWGGVEAIEIATVLVVFLVCAFLEPAQSATILFAGLFGVVIFVLTQGVAQSFEMEAGTDEAPNVHTETVAKAGAALFVYLNVLDSAFSLDGVVGAFAITSNLPVIIAGLGIGALFVRSFTIMLVRAKTLETLVYLEHGAHYAILGLAVAMLLSIFIEIPETITGFIGLVFIGLAYFSSIRERA